MKRRCAWAGDDLNACYHDEEWGVVPLHDDVGLFEFLTLEGAQAGLSWSTILRKRPEYRKAFAGFDPRRVARFTAARVERLLTDEGIVRHRGKINSTITNARAFLAVQREHGSFDAYLWRFVDGQPVQNRWTSSRQVPAATPMSQTLSRDLIRRGFTFVGPTICYAFMQATGMVNDHTLDCFRHPVGHRGRYSDSCARSARPRRTASRTVAPEGGRGVEPWEGPVGPFPRRETTTQPARVGTPPR
jgi:DNA-3-methyladenine glycosylase I